MASETESSPPSVDWSHILVETSGLDDVIGALRGSSRLRFTCLDASSKYLVLGSNTGTVYVFGRSNQKHPQIIFPEIDPAQVNCVSISPTDKAIAFSTLKGHVLVVELSLDKRQKPERLRLINDHLHTTVTCITWDSTGSKLYTADSAGRTFVTSVQSSKVQNLVSLPPEVILKLESPIYQLEISEDKLLVSTLHKCYLCYTTRHKFTQIGTKPRDGEYGACFYRQPSTGLYRMFCARPGARVWEVDMECNVLQTHMFKQLLAIPFLPMVCSVDYSWQTPSQNDTGPKVPTFSKLKITSENFLYSWSKNYLYVLDPVNVKVIFWIDLGSEIQNIVSSDGYLFIFFFNGNIKKTKIYLIPHCVSFLISKQSWVLAAKVCSYFQTLMEKMRWWKCLSLSDLEKLQVQCKSSGKDQEAVIIDEIKASYPLTYESSSEMEDSFSDRSRSSSNASVQKLDSGIYRINSPSLPCPEISSIPDDLQHGLQAPDNPLLQSLRTEIIDLIDNTSVLEMKDDDMSQTSTSYTDNDICAENHKITPTNDKCNQQNSETNIVIDKLDTRGHENDENSQRIEENKENIGIIGKKNENEEKKEENNEYKADILKSEREVPVSSKDSITATNKDSVVMDTQPENDYLLRKSSLPENINGVNIDMVRTSSSIEKELDMENSKKLISMETVSEDELKPVVASGNSYGEPVVVSPSNQIKHKRSRRKKSVNDILLDGDLKQPPKMKRSKSLTSISKSAEKKHSHRQVANETLFEEGFIHTIANAKSDLDLTADNKSLNDVDFGSSPGSSLAQSWESTGSETIAGIRKKALSSMIDSVQSKLITTKKKFIAMRQSRLSRSPGGEGKSTPDSVSMDSVDGVISTAEKLQEEVALIVKAPIDLSDLQKSTEETRKLLQDVNILLNPTELQKTLSCWIRQLNQSLCQLHTFIYVERLKKFHSCSKQKPNDVDINKICNDNNEYNENINNSGVNSSKVKDGSGTIDSSGVKSSTVKVEGDGMINKTDVGSPAQTMVNTKNLEVWLEEENLDFRNIGHVKDPFFMSTDFQENVAELTQMCFDCGCYGDIANFICPRDFDKEEICKKCGEVFDLENASKNKLYRFNQRDSGFSENEEKKNDLKELITEDIVNSEVTTDSDKNVGINHSILTNETLTDRSEVIPNTQTVCQSDNPSLSEGGQVVFTDNDEEQVDNCISEDSCLKEFPDHTTLSKISSNLEAKNNKKVPHSCLYCHQSNTICYHGNGYFSIFSEIKTFVQVYFFLLDMDKVRNKAYSLTDPSYETWSGIMNSVKVCCRENLLYNNMEKEIYTVTDLLKRGELPQNRVIGYISRLFEIKPNKAIDVCVSSSIILPLDVLYLCEWHNLPVDKYLDTYMKAKMTNNEGLNLLNNVKVITKWMEILLRSTSHEDKIFDENGNPRPWSHLVKWKDQETIEHVISTANEHSIQHHLDLCLQFGYWNGYLSLLKCLERFEDMLIIILYLEDITLLDSNRSNGALPKTTEEWKWFLGKFSSIHQRQRKKECNLELPACEDENLTENDLQLKPSEDPDDRDEAGAPEHTCITWDDMGQLMLQNLGPVTTVQLIQEGGWTEEMFSLSFFQSCFLSSFIHRQQRNVTHSLLERLDSYLWTKKSNVLMPELQYLVSREKDGTTEAKKEDNNDSILYLTSDESLTSKQYKEDMESHWGTSAKINRCCKNCNIQLTETVSHVEPGILIFPCGHGFHKFCCPLRECILCMDLDSA